MKIVITGASGFIGRQLIPLLSADNHELILVGRNIETLTDLYPNHVAVDYDGLRDENEIFMQPDVFLHLAAANNDSKYNQQYFKSVNVDFAAHIASVANKLKAGCFVNVTSLHAVRVNNQSYYAESKRLGELAISKELNIPFVNLRLPAAYGTLFSGNMAILNKLPSPVRLRVLKVLSLIKPVIYIGKIPSVIENIVRSKIYGEYLFTDCQENNNYYSYCKNIFDYAAAAILFAVFAVPLAIFIIMIRLDSTGNAIFAQQRVGLNGMLFTCYKLRTMRIGTVQAGTHEVSASAVTNVGHFLRRTKLDELPQLWNILRGEMSFVGPRPCLPSQDLLIEARKKRGVLGMKPGITGLAQVEGIDMSDHKRLANRDEDYLKLRALVLDFKILVFTALGKGSGDRVS